MARLNHNTSIELENQNEKELNGSDKNSLVQKLVVYGCIALVAITVIVVLSVFLTQPAKPSMYELSAPNGTTISLEDVLEGRLYARSFNGTWYDNDQMLYRDIVGNVILINVSTNESKILLSAETAPYNEGVKFDLSPDGKYLLIARDYKRLYRSSFSAIYDILDLKTGVFTPLTIAGAQQQLLIAEWNTKTNGLVFNYLYNLYYKKSPDAPEIQLTFDGSQTVFNGVPDWVYEEEILSANSAMWFSPDGKFLAFVKFDDTQVPFIDIPVYGPPGSIQFQYPLSRFIHYPKSGAPNPVVTLSIVDLDDLDAGRPIDITVVKPPKEVTNDNIIATVAWADNQSLIPVWMNRIQNKAVIQKCLLDKCDTVALLESSTGWIELYKQPLFNEDGSELAILASQSQGDAGAYRHVTKISTEANGKSLALTKGKYVAIELLNWNPDDDFIFYTANLANSTESKHLFAVKANGTSEPQCLTCGMISLSTKKPQHYFEAEFSKNGRNFLLTTKGPDVPEEHIYTWKEVNGKVQLKRLGTWDDNSHLRMFLKDRSVPQEEIHEIYFGDYSAKVILQVPRNIDRSGKIKYPMLVDVYGGPDSFSVTKKFSLDWGSYMAANRSVIYARIDGRGSGLRGDKLLHQVYRRLGTVEVEDQLLTARKLAEKLPYIDRKRMGIWGWSYGGYASGLALARDNNSVFQCAASVAPVTDWLYYDSMYTERFMDIPQRNPEGYFNSKLITLAEGFRGKKYLVIHGTLDDNVHFQQSMALVKTLERHDILFKEVSYPDEDHSLAGVRLHLYHTLEKFFGDCFGINKRYS